MKREFTVTQARVLKEGGNANGPWKLLGWTGDDGKRYSVFESKPNAGLVSMGDRIKCEVTYSEKFDNYSIESVAFVSAAPLGAKMPASSDAEEEGHNAQLDRIEGMLKELFPLVQRIVAAIDPGGKSGRGTEVKGQPAQPQEEPTVSIIDAKTIVPEDLPW